MTGEAPELGRPARPHCQCGCKVLSTHPISSSILGLPGPEGCPRPCVAGTEEPEAIFASGSLVQAHVRDGNQDRAVPTVTCHWHPWVVHSGQRLSVLLVPGGVSGCCPGHYWEPWASKALPSGQTGAPCHMVVGDSCTRGPPAGVRGPPLVVESKEPQAAEGEGAIWVGSMSGSPFATFGSGRLCHD